MLFRWSGIVQPIPVGRVQVSAWWFVVELSESFVLFFVPSHSDTLQNIIQEVCVWRTIARFYSTLFFNFKIMNVFVLSTRDEESFWVRREFEYGGSATVWTSMSLWDGLQRGFGRFGICLNYNNFFLAFKCERLADVRLCLCFQISSLSVKFQNDKSTNLFFSCLVLGRGYFLSRANIRWYSLGKWM